MDKLYHATILLFITFDMSNRPIFLNKIQLGSTEVRVIKTWYKQMYSVIFLTRMLSVHGCEFIILWIQLGGGKKSCVERVHMALLDFLEVSQ